MLATSGMCLVLSSLPKRKRLLHGWRHECLPVVSGEVEDSKKCFAQFLIWVGRVGLLPARGCELIDQQGSHPILQWICTPHQTYIYTPYLGSDP